VVYEHQQKLYIGRILSILHVPELNKWICCVSQLNVHKVGQVVYNKSLKGYHVINVNYLKDQMVYTSAQKLLTETSSDFFSVPSSGTEDEYPLEDEEQELLDFIRQKYKQQFGRILEVE